jgi:hypothetical protein
MSGNITANVPPSIPITITFLFFINLYMPPHQVRKELLF